MLSLQTSATFLQTVQSVSSEPVHKNPLTYDELAISYVLCLPLSPHPILPPSYVNMKELIWVEKVQSSSKHSLGFNNWVWKKFCLHFNRFYELLLLLFAFE